MLLLKNFDAYALLVPLQAKTGIVVLSRELHREFVPRNCAGGPDIVCILFAPMNVALPFGATTIMKYPIRPGQ